MPNTIEISKTIIDEINDLSSNWIVVVFNNETNTFDQVIGILLMATRCTPAEAIQKTQEIHENGEAVVFISDEITCNKVAHIISSIGLVTQVEKE